MLVYCYSSVAVPASCKAVLFTVALFFMYQEAKIYIKIIGAILILIDIVIGTFIFINLIVAVAANTLVSLLNETSCCLTSLCASEVMFWLRFACWLVCLSARYCSCIIRSWNYIYWK